MDFKLFSICENQRNQGETEITPADSADIHRKSILNFDIINLSTCSKQIGSKLIFIFDNIKTSIMKKILFISLLAFSLKTSAQINLEHVYDSASTLGICNAQSQLMIIDFALSGYQYVKINRCGKCIGIYNMSHALVKTISLANVPADSVIYNQVGDILYLSQNLFSTDSKIDFMYCFEYSESGNTIHITDIYNEDAVLIFSDTSYPAIRANFEQQQLPIYNTPEGAKMILSCANGQAKVFSLPGKLPSCCNEDDISSYAVPKQSIPTVKYLPLQV